MAIHTLCHSPSLMSPGVLPGAAVSSTSSNGSCCCAFSGRGFGVSASQLSVPWNQGAARRCSFPLHVVAEDVEAVATPLASSDGLTMNLKVEGTLSDSLISKVTDVLKNVEGVTNLKVYTAEGIATVELSKPTTIQATGEASTLLEKIQAEGFKLQNLSISFDDPGADGDVEIAYEYESAS